MKKHSTHSWVIVNSPDIASPLPAPTPRPTFKSICSPLLVRCLLLKHCIKSTHLFQSICTLFWEKSNLYVPLLDIFQSYHHLYPIIQIYMYPLLGNWFIYRHYISSVTPFHSTSWVTVNSPDITSPPSFHSNLCFPCWVGVNSLNVL